MGFLSGVQLVAAEARHDAHHYHIRCTRGAHREILIFAK